MFKLVETSGASMLNGGLDIPLFSCYLVLCDSMAFLSGSGTGGMGSG